MIKIYNYGQVSNQEIFARDNISANVEDVVAQIIAAVNEAMRAADDDSANNMSRLTGGLNLGGLF